MKRVLCWFLLLLICGCQTPSPQTTATPEVNTPSPTTSERTLTCIGDSLTEGMGVVPGQTYPDQLGQRLKDDGFDWEVVNAGISGETSSGALSRLDWVLKSKPDAVLLVTGANDALRGVDPAITEKNIDTIVGRLKDEGVTVLLGGMMCPPNLGADFAAKFEPIYPRVAEKHKVAFIPFFLKGVARVPELNQADGKHPTAEGYSKVVDHIYPDVKALLSTFK